MSNFRSNLDFCSNSGHCSFGPADSTLEIIEEIFGKYTNLETVSYPPYGLVSALNNGFAVLSANWSAKDANAMIDNGSILRL